MEPIRTTKVTLVDLLDRILDKGVVINADVMISVAGIPLIGICLRAALAGMETMSQYGLMQDWDKNIRDWESECRKNNALCSNSFSKESLQNEKEQGSGVSSP